MSIHPFRHLSQYRTRLKLQPAQALFVMINGRELVAMSKTMLEVWRDDHDEDGFLYMVGSCVNDERIHVCIAIHLHLYAHQQVYMSQEAFGGDDRSRFRAAVVRSSSDERSSGVSQWRRCPTRRIP